MSNLFSKLNTQQSMDNFRPLTDVTSDAVKAKLEAEDYAIGFTAQSWKEKFPRIPAKNVYFGKAVVYPPFLMYYDKKTYIIFYIPYTCGLYSGMGEENPEKLQDEMLKMIEDRKKALHDKDYLRLLFPVISEENGNIAMAVAREMLLNERPSSKLYDAVISAYTLCNRGVGKLGVDGIKRLAACKNKKQKEKTANKLSNLPDEITIYRGEANESIPYEQACSWTLRRSVAYGIATWHTTDGAVLRVGKVKKSDVIEYIDSDEDEIIVLGSNVYDVETERGYSSEEFVEVIAATMFDEKHMFPQTTMPTAIIKRGREAYAKREELTRDHTSDHAIRVALLASFLFRIEVLLRKASLSTKEFELSHSAYEQLIEAAIYHDAGRDDESENTEHGAAGYKAYCEDNAPDPVVDFLCTFHCCEDDGDARTYWEEHFADDKKKDYIWDAFLILRDADALDRVRFHSMAPEYLDYDQLRLQTSKKLVFAAIQLSKEKISLGEDE